MKKISVLLAILVCFFCLGLAFVSCDDGSSGGGGGSSSLPGTSWKYNSYTLNFIDSSNWRVDATWSSNCASGYYSVSGKTVTITCTYENTGVFGPINNGDTRTLQFKNSNTLTDEYGQSWVKE